MVIVPSIDVRGGRVATTVTDPEALAARLVRDGAEELHLVDLDAAEHGQPRNGKLLARIARTSGVPARLAGGLTDPFRARAALDGGFAGVFFSSAVFGGGELLLREVAALGGGAIVEIEAHRGRLAPRGGDATLAARAAGCDALAAASAALAAGVGALYVIEVAADGRLGGPPLDLLDRLREGLRGDRVAYHAGGGVRDLADVRALSQRAVSSVVIGRALAEGRFTIAQAKAACA